MFENNRFRSNVADSLLRMGQNTTLPAAHLNQHYGSGNSHDGVAQTEQFPAAGHTWTCEPAQQRLLRDGAVVDGLI